jgi:hypothetical protein
MYKKGLNLFFVTGLDKPAKSPAFKTLNVSVTVRQGREVSASYKARATNAV